jgi:signal peptide peptidase SppA
MRLIDIVNAPWAITPEMHEEIQSIYARHMRGEKINLASIEAAIGKPLSGPTRGYDVVNGVAVLGLDGVLAKRMNLFMQISGGTSMQIAANDFREALADPEVNAIILAIDSPGGTVDGTQELSDLIYSARDQKPIIALADGTMASAAYWIGSAASKVFTSNLTNTIGSIGVVQSHVDISRAQDMNGVKTTEITAGKYKRIASQYGPLSQEGRDTLQDQVNQVYSVFVDTVARNRGVSVQTVLDNMADGRVFIGQQAIDAGLVDGVSTLDALIARVADGEFNPQVDDAQQVHAAAGAPRAEVKTNQIAESAGDAPQATEEEKTMDVQTLKAEHPDVAQALINEGKELGATAERERIKAVEAQSMPGHDALIATLKFDGKTSGPEAAVQVLAAEKAKKGDQLAALRADAAAANVPHAAAGDNPDPEDPDEDDDEDEDEEAKNARIAKAGGPAAVAAAAREYQQKKNREGVKVSTAEAVAYVTKHLTEARHG